MHFMGVQEISASRADVWRALNDPAIIQQCIPGCERYEEIEPAKYEAVVVASIGPVWASFSATVTVSDHVLDEGYRIEAKGSGVMAGLGNLAASVDLVDSEWGTSLSYSAEAQISDSLSHLGSHLIQAAATRFSEAFFARFNALLVSGAE